MTKAPGGDISVKVGGVRVVLERDVNYALRVAARRRDARARARSDPRDILRYRPRYPLRRRSSRRAAPYGADYARGAVGLDVTRRRTCHPRPQRTARGRPARGAQEPQPGPDARPARRPPESFRDVEEENSVEVLKC